MYIVEVMNVLNRLRYRAKLRTRRWLRENPKWLKKLRQFRCFSGDPESVSRGFAIGLFFGLTPTVGIQTFLVLPSCLMLRGNFPMAFMATWVSNPLTLVPLYWLFENIGSLFISGSILSPDTAAAWPILQFVTSGTLKMLLGSLFIATPMAILSYFVVYRLAKLNLMRHQGVT
ncbi:DUF2062 domain-containing protein [Halomonas sp. SpR1]|uniref:DUF2062 domain-containing protein n=1 Tax=Halomonas sp. SpR1 TaxID=3050462 RepID=UPI0027E4CAFD|nr:DUF2062 domain-containing protein [Halomonas sp. SpR1]MDQ7731782.1 DUF2062 domain-containing protein [Halomonas sp. SpR1]